MSRHMILPEPFDYVVDSSAVGGTKPPDYKNRPTLGKLDVVEGDVLHFSTQVMSGTATSEAGDLMPCETLITMSGILLARIQVPDENGVPHWHSCSVSSNALLQFLAQHLDEKLAAQTSQER